MACLTAVGLRVSNGESVYKSVGNKKGMENMASFLYVQAMPNGTRLRHYNIIILGRENVEV